MFAMNCHCLVNVVCVLSIDTSHRFGGRVNDRIVLIFNIPLRGNL